VERRVKRLAEAVNKKDFVGNGDTYHKHEPFHSTGNISKLVRYSGMATRQAQRTIQAHDSNDRLHCRHCTHEHCSLEHQDKSLAPR
jgi:hypothetical protein